MKSIAKLVALSIVIAGSACATTSNITPTDQARTIFSKYISLEHSFDPAIADIYCDTALIRNTRKYPNGQTRTLELPPLKYKELIRAAMPVAKDRGDYSTYTDVVYSPEGENVRVTAARYSVLKKYTSPMSLLIGSCNGGAWSVLEEIGESQP